MPPSTPRLVVLSIASLVACSASTPTPATSSEDAGQSSPTPDASGNADDGGGALDASMTPNDAPAGSGHDASLDAHAKDAATGTPTDAGYVDRGANPSTVLVRVSNGCPMNLWIHATGQEATLKPDNVQLAPGATQDYDAPLTWTAARVYAYLKGPDAQGNPQGQNDKVEASFYVTNGSEYLNTDVTYVDWLALPSQIQTFGTGSDCTTAGCEVPYSGLLAGCPPSLLSGQECLAARTYCLDPTHGSDPYCHALDAQISACAAQYPDCAGAAGSTTAEVYACSGPFFSTANKYCAALNRGILGTPDPGTPASSFYKSPPFNTYSQWVHERCPGIYAFPYDDYGSSNQSSDHTCTGATQMNVTFCPKG